MSSNQISPESPGNREIVKKCYLISEVSPCIQEGSELLMTATDACLDPGPRFDLVAPHRYYLLVNVDCNNDFLVNQLETVDL